MKNTRLFDKIHASMLAAAIGDAMGGPVEGWTYQKIAETYGIVDNFLPYGFEPDYHNHFATAPGTVTDDTRLRHILCRAILQRGDLPRRGDFIQALIEAYYAAETEIERGFLEEYALAAMHGDDKLAWDGQPTNGFIMANAPLGLVCPCDSETAFASSFAIDFISGGYARYAAAMAAAAVSAAMHPEATVTSVIDTALAACRSHRREGRLTREWTWYEHVFQVNERLINSAVEIASRHADVFALRGEYYQALQNGPLGSEAGQTLAVPLGMLVAAGGNLKQTIIGCVNYGRDNDSYASVAGAIAGALHGTRAIPTDWIETINAANPHPDIAALSLDLTRVIARRQRKLAAVTAAAAPLLSS